MDAGDRMVLPAGTRHAAVVGPAGCSCIEGKARTPPRADGETEW